MLRIARAPSHRINAWCGVVRTIFATLIFFGCGAVFADPGSNTEAKIDQAWATYGVSGRGVIIAPIDRGIDWKHPDFRNADGSTRIEAIYDLTDDTGASAANNPYGKGTIYTREQINAALNGGTALATRDAVGHGTATAGGSAGNGAASGGKYRAPAYNATLVVVKYVSEGAPAHGSIPAEAAFNQPERFPLAIRFVTDTAKRLGLPAVMHANFGSVTGPMDGTGAYADAINAAVGPGKPGLVFVTGSSDDGGSDNYAEGQVAQGASIDLPIQKGAANGTTNLRCLLWYPGSDEFDATLITPQGTFGPFTAPASNAVDSQQVGGVNYYQSGNAGTPNGKRYVLLDIGGAPGTYTLHLTARKASTGFFQASLNPSRTLAPVSTDNKFLAFVKPGHTIWDAAAAANNITPNNYIYKSGTGGTVGDLWIGSGIGPTCDGRTGIDLSSPGEGTIVPLGADSYWSTFTGLGPSDGNGKYIPFGAVSGATPIVTGTIALMLERNPWLDAKQVRDILHSSARSDSFTGPVPNTRWGYGKLDAAAALASVAALATFNLDQHGLTGSWYNPATSGQGFEIEVYPDMNGVGKGVIGMGWYTFDTSAAGGQRWYVLQGTAVAGAASAALVITTATGGNFNAAPVVNAIQVGTATLSFSDCHTGSLTYQFNDGRSGTIPLSRLNANISCTPSGDSSVAASNYLQSGAWYNAATGGQGFFFDFMPTLHVLAAAWYTYVPNGSAVGGGASQHWYTIQDNAFVPGTLVKSGIPILETTGGTFNTVGGTATVQVGTAAIALQSCASMTLNYTFTGGTNAGKTGSIALSRIGPVPGGCAQ